jgi:hypothetical protein
MKTLILTRRYFRVQALVVSIFKLLIYCKYSVDILIMLKYFLELLAYKSLGNNFDLAL